MAFDVALSWMKLSVNCNSFVRISNVKPIFEMMSKQSNYWEANRMKNWESKFEHDDEWSI